MPSSRAARMTRTAISPRLAIRIFFSTAANVGAVDDGGPNPRPTAPAGWTVEHVAATGSTNADLLATAGTRPDRSVLVADHQTAGRGRLDRRWDAPPGASLLVSLLFHRVPADPGEPTPPARAGPGGSGRAHPPARAGRRGRLPGGRRCRRRAEVAQRRARGRPQARGHPRPALGGGRGRDRARPERPLGAGGRRAPWGGRGA